MSALAAPILDKAMELAIAFLKERESQRAFDMFLLGQATPAQKKRYLETIIVREEATAKNVSWWQARADKLGNLFDGE